MVRIFIAIFLGRGTGTHRRTVLRLYTTALAMLVASTGCNRSNSYAGLESALNEFVNGKDATIGIAVIIDGRDTVAVNGNREFPMLSVYKLPIALALADLYRADGRDFDTRITITSEDLHPDTYSPMTERIIASDMMVRELSMTTRGLLRYMLALSDNNASDIILKKALGPESVERYLHSTGIKGINVRHTESEMHTDNNLCYQNSATPIAMASLLNKVDSELSDSLSLEIKQIIETCETGGNRLRGAVFPEGTIIGHKTGTGFMLPDGRLMAVNDAGYVRLPSGRRYSIAVFIENSGSSMEQTEGLIAEISQIVLSVVRQ